METAVEMTPRALVKPSREPATRSFVDYLAEVSESTDVRRGIPMPLGAHAVEGGVNFALFSRHATRVRLELFVSADDLKPARAIELDPGRNRTGDIWHVWIKGVLPGQLYAYRLDGPNDASMGQRFDFDQLLLDPCAVAIKRPTSREVPLKCVFASEHFNWQDDKPLRHPWSQTVLYETHVRGLTAHSSSRVRFPGTYRGVTEKIPYLKELGITALELLPVQEFDASRCKRHDPQTGERLRDYWGYEPIALFAPNGAYSSAGDSGQQILEFKEMVRQLHAAGIEVIVDIVLEDLRRYVDAAGRGTSLNAHHPVVLQLIIGALRYWVMEMHVDGFRFELASIVGRNHSGCAVLCNPSLLEQIAEDPILRDTKLIAAAWDAAGAYRVRSYPERSWAEWNFHFRDDVRRFWRGDEGMLGAFASRICGSEDLYGGSGKGPECGINFVTSHDGFTLADLVSFRNKHNIANGEGNLDGPDENFSANYGAEGPTEDGRIESIRKRQVKNFLLTVLISRGVPMLLGGDELGRTQHGNNNAYCQDNETSWYDWSGSRRHADIHAFVKNLITFRRSHPVLSREQFYTAEELRWLSPALGQPAWGDPRARTAGCLVRDRGGDTLCFIFNAEGTSMSFLVPYAPPRCEWRLAVDTSTDLPVSGSGPLVQGGRSYKLAPRSSVVLVAAPAAVAAAACDSADPAVKTVQHVAGRGCDPMVDSCAGAMGGDDAEAAYAAAVLWYQGYPELAGEPPRPDAP
jgi:glycogen operon protein